MPSYKFFVAVIMLNCLLISAYSQSLSSESLFNKGKSYYDSSKFDLAITHFTEAINQEETQSDINYSDLAKYYYYAGTAYYSDGRYDLAAERLSSALDHTSAHNINARYLIDIYLFLAEISAVKDEYNSALEMADKAQKIAAKEKDSTQYYNSILFYGFIYKQMSDYQTALDYYNQSLDYFLQKDLKTLIAKNKINIAQIQAILGNLDIALRLYEEAIEILDVSQNDNLLSIAYSGIAQIYLEFGVYSKSIEYLNKSLHSAKEKDKAITYNNLAHCYSQMKEMEKAYEFYNKAIELEKNSGRKSYFNSIQKNMIVNNPDITPAEKIKILRQFLDKTNESDQESQANLLANIGSQYSHLNDYKKATKYYYQAYELYKKLKMLPEMAFLEHNMGTAYFVLNNYELAISYFEKSIENHYYLRNTIQGPLRRDYANKISEIYSDLAYAHLARNEVYKALQVMEYSSSNFLFEQLYDKQKKLPFVSVLNYRKKIEKDVAIFRFMSSQDKILGYFYLGEEIIGYIGNNDFSYIITNLYSKYKDEIEIYHALSFEKTLVKNQNHSELTAIIHYYRHLITKPNSTSKENQIRIDIAKSLYIWLFAGMDTNEKFDLMSKKELVIIPEGELGFIPFETLIMPNGQYLVERYAIKYWQSISISNYIASRKANSKGPVLSLGGAVYTKPDSTEPVRSRSYFEVADQALSRGNEYRTNFYKKYFRWNDLPGSKKEAERIIELNNGGTLLTGNNASENAIMKLNNNHELKKYKVIHLATHGIVVPDIPELSALVLSQVENESCDGYLNMHEIANLEIMAEFVNLSACRTGLGKIYNGEGIVGLTQAFLLAGAKSVSVSLWNIDDTGTQQFMESVYEKALVNEMDFNHAMRNTKIDFLKGNHGIKYQHPYYWGAFVFYGNTDEKKRPTVKSINRAMWYLLTDDHDKYY